MYTYSGMKKTTYYVKKCEPNASMIMQENGYITSEIFLEWLGHFVKNILGGISKDNTHLQYWMNMPHMLQLRNLLWSRS